MIFMPRGLVPTLAAAFGHAGWRKGAAGTSRGTPKGAP
jgi:hypothetical protein